MKISEKDIGRRVVVNGGYDCEVFNNEPGVLKCFGPIANKPGIAFDKPRAGFHDLYGRCEDGHGYYVPESMVTFIEEENKMDMDFQVGDEVEMVRYLCKGVVAEISSVECNYPVFVKWENGATDSCDIFGKLQGFDDYPTIYHSGSIKREGSKIIIDPVKPKWVNVLMNTVGEPFIYNVKYSSFDEASKAVSKYVNTHVATIQLKRKNP